MKIIKSLLYTLFPYRCDFLCLYQPNYCNWIPFFLSPKRKSSQSFRLPVPEPTSSVNNLPRGEWAAWPAWASLAFPTPPLALQRGHQAVWATHCDCDPYGSIWWRVHSADTWLAIHLARGCRVQAINSRPWNSSHCISVSCLSQHCWEPSQHLLAREQCMTTTVTQHVVLWRPLLTHRQKSLASHYLPFEANIVSPDIV